MKFVTAGGEICLSLHIFFRQNATHSSTKRPKLRHLAALLFKYKNCNGEFFSHKFPFCSTSWTICLYQVVQNADPDKKLIDIDKSHICCTCEAILVFVLVLIVFFVGGLVDVVLEQTINCLNDICYIIYHNIYNINNICSLVDVVLEQTIYD